MKRLSLVAFGFFWVTLAAGRAEAACTVSSTGVSFGNYDVLSGSHLNSTGTVSYTCNNNNNNIVITLSTGGSGSYATRTLSGPDALSYNLFLDASATTIWGDGSAGTSTHSQNSVPRNQTFNVTVYGRVFAGQDVRAGSYSDSITVTMTF